MQAIGEDGKTLLSTGKLTLVDNQMDPSTGTLKLKASFVNEDERLWPGLFVNVRLIVDTRRGVATVPRRPCRTGPTGSYAYVIKDDNTVERRPVEVAAVQDGVAVIGKGLTPGEKVVVEGQYRLTTDAAGSPLRIRPEIRTHRMTTLPPARPRRQPFPHGTRAMSISATFIRRPIATSLMMLVSGVRDRRLQPAAGGGAAQCRLSDHHRQRQLAGRQPDTMASSVATPLEQQFAAIPGLAR